MLAAVFSLAVLGSLTVSALLFLEIIPGTPRNIAIIAAAHIVPTALFFRAYRRYYGIHRLVAEGHGELFGQAIGRMVGRERFPQMRRHLRSRRAQGLVHAGQPLEALAATAEVLSDPGIGRAEVLAAHVAEVEANLELEQLAWARRALESARKVPRSDGDEGLRAVAARLEHVEGRPQVAAVELERLRRARGFPLTRVVRARNLLWLGEALESAGRHHDAARVLSRAIRYAPRSVYGRRAERALVRLRRAARPGVAPLGGLAGP